MSNVSGSEEKIATKTKNIRDRKIVEIDKKFRSLFLLLANWIFKKA